MDIRDSLIQLTKKLLALSRRRGSKLTFHYMRILRELRNINEPVTFLSRIKSIGPGLREKYLRYLSSKVITESASSCSERCDTDHESRMNESEGSSNRSDSDITVVRSSVPLGVLSSSQGRAREKNNSSYIPSYRSGAYAIMMALGKKDGLSREEIFLEGSKYCDKEFTSNERYTPWSSIKTLIDKNLVMKEGRPATYFLTDTGKAMSKRLILTSDLSNNSCKPEKDAPHEDILSGRCSPINNKEEIVVFIDSRETKSRKERLYFQSGLSKLNVKNETRQLRLGDFLWMVNGRVVGIAERKRGDDFISSISDGRLMDQISRMVSMNIKNIFYIIENLGKKPVPSATFSILSELKWMNLTVLETESISETLEALKDISEELRNSVGDMSYGSFVEAGVKDRGATVGDHFYRTMLSVSGLGVENTKRICDEYGTLLKFINCATKHKLREIGVSKKIIERIYDLIGISHRPS